ncbi:MAG: biotin--[acetyl-CoA-carboxylase] ligase [Candidatus Thorarchaeota archaeon]|nr:MAG: biotin--[acetyl-CoA-carboxylase] ligase [Candidatus Thorarchaeota archaeon]
MKIEDCFITNILKPRVILLESVGSTSTEAKDLLTQGETEGIIVLAHSQTEGRGRKDRIWLSPVGGLYFSIVLKPRLGNENTPLLGILCACAVRRALHGLDVNVQVKWPNDILVDDRKIAGILSEAVTIGNETIGIVIGIGVNQNCPISEMPSGLQWPATSVIDEIGKETSNESLLCDIVNEIDSLLEVVEINSSFSAVVDEWRKTSSTLGKTVRIHEDDKITDGIARNIGEDGSLLVETEDGLVSVLLGDVHHVRPGE